MHQNSNLSSSANRLSHRSNFKNYKFSSFNNGNNLDNVNYNRSLNEIYGLQPVMPYSLQNLLVLDNSQNHQDLLGQQFNSEIPTPPLPPNLSTVANFTNLHQHSKQQKPLIKQRSLAAIDLDQYSDAHFRHHLQQLAQQFNQLQTNSRQQLNLHRTVSTDNFDKYNLINHQTIDNPVSQGEDLLYTSQDYSPDLDVHLADNQVDN